MYDTKKSRKGFAPIAIMIFALIGIAVVSGMFYYAYHMTTKSVSTTPPGATAPVASSTTATSTQVASSSTSTTISGSGYKAYLTPSSGPVDTSVTIHGSGFAATGNQVVFGGLVSASLTNVPSVDGKLLTFIVPATLGPDCKPDQACPEFLLEVTPRTYTVSVISNGVTQDFGSFTVTREGGVSYTPQSSASGQ